MNTELIVILSSVIHSGVRLATPYLYAAIGETYGQRSGVLNLGVEGIMLMGAYTAFYVTLQTGSPWLGFLAAALVGLLMGLAMAVISVTFKAEQGISGIGLFLFGLGLSELLFKTTVRGIALVEGFRELKIPALEQSSSALLRAIDKIFFSYEIVVYLAFLIVPVATFVLNRTTWGLKIRAVGQNPQAADTLGISVERVRYLTVTFGGIMSALAGASLSIALQNGFQQGMTAGQGFIAVALVYFGGWRPGGVLVGALIFSLATSVQNWVKTLRIPIPYEFAVMIPYVVTILALIVAVQRVQQPAALTKTFERGEQ